MSWWKLKTWTDMWHFFCSFILNDCDRGQVKRMRGSKYDIRSRNGDDEIKHKTQTNVNKRRRKKFFQEKVSVLKDRPCFPLLISIATENLYWKHTGRLSVFFSHHVIVIVADMNVCLFALLNWQSKCSRATVWHDAKFHMLCVCSSYRWNVVFCQQKCLGYFTFFKLFERKLQIQQIDSIFWIVDIVPFFVAPFTSIHNCALLFCEKFSFQIRITFHFMFRFDVDTFSVRPKHWIVCTSRVCTALIQYGKQCIHVYLQMVLDISINVCAFFVANG